MVDELNFPETFRDDERGLKPGLWATPCLSRFGRRGSGENDLCCGGGEPVGVGFAENRSSHIFMAKAWLSLWSKVGPYYLNVILSSFALDEAILTSSLPRICIDC